MANPPLPAGGLRASAAVPDPKSQWCPRCAEPNPPGFVWCRACKEPLRLAGDAPAGANRIALFAIGGVLLLAIGMVFGSRLSRSAPDHDPAVAAPVPSSPPTTGSRRALRESMEKWSRSATTPPAGTATDPAPGETVVSADEPTPSFSGNDPSASPAPPLVTMEDVRVRREGDDTVYTMQVRHGDRVYPVTVRGRVHLSPEGIRFEPTSVETGELPVDPAEIERQLREMRPGR